MAYYYLVNNKAELEHKFFEIMESHRAEFSAIRSAVEAEAVTNGYTNKSWVKHEYDNRCKPLREQVRREQLALLDDASEVIGTRKAEVCAEACRICDEFGMTETEIVKSPCHGYFDQSWFVYKEDGVWYQKMDRECKAKHEVLL